MKKTAFHNLGCKVNSYEWEVMQQMLQEKGYEIVPFDEAADIYIINTCTVTNIADRKSRQMIHRAKQINPDAIVVAVGCYVQLAGEAVERDTGIDLAIGNNRKGEIVSILEQYLEQRQEGAQGYLDDKADGQSKPDGRTKPDKTLGGTTIPDIAHTKTYEPMTLRRTLEHTRAYIKIQDGCNQFCAYCAIPYARGRARSRKAEEILEEIKGLAAAGYKEVVLTGIHISSYGADFAAQGKAPSDVAGAMTASGSAQGMGTSLDAGCAPLIELVERIHEIEGVERIRLGSMEPRIVTQEAVRRLARLPKLCPHFHLSLQSGCDETLRRMNRHYTTGEYYHCVELLREAFDHPAITTDVIVGFPGETQEEFHETKLFLEKVNFYEMHVFQYSRRKNTPADRMDNQLPERTKALRSGELLALAKRQSGEFRERYIGREAQVLLEEAKEIGGAKYFLGHTKDYVRIAVLERADGDAVGQRLASNEMINVMVQGYLTEEILIGALRS